MPVDHKKRCAYCHMPKRLMDFNISASAIDGRQSYCKTCQGRDHVVRKMLEKSRALRERANEERERLEVLAMGLK